VGNFEFLTTARNRPPSAIYFFGKLFFPRAAPRLRLLKGHPAASSKGLLPLFEHSVNLGVFEGSQLGKNFQTRVPWQFFFCNGQMTSDDDARFNVQNSDFEVVYFRQVIHRFFLNE
jgi:hypothetical protein